MTANDDVYILTARFDDEAFTQFNELRREYFPTKINKIPAHVTLFHHLPGKEIVALRDDLSQAAARQFIIPAHAPGLRFLGKGMAVEIDAPELIRFRADLANRWEPLLVPQDRQRFKPHVTIQNKVNPPAARALFERLDARWEPFDFTFIGATLWKYLGGPWEQASEFCFTG